MIERTKRRDFWLLALGVLAVAGPARAADFQCAHGVERRGQVDVAGATRVVVNARAGDLDLRPAAGRSLVASGRACASSDKYLQQTQLRVRREGETVLIDVLVPDAMVGIGIFYARLDLTVEVPAGLAVEVSDSSGDIAARGVRVAQVTDSSGDIVLRDLQGDVEVWDSSGDVRIENAPGRVQVRDSSGDIVIVGAASVIIPSDSSGDIDVQRVAGSVRIEQDSSGDIRVADVGRDFTLLGDSSGDVRITGVKGNVQVP